METTVGLSLAIILLFVGLFFGWRQRATLTKLRRDDQMPREERVYLSSQVRRRLLCSVLMIVIAGLLVGWLLMEPRLRDFVPVEGEPVPEEAKDDFRFFTYYWITILLVVLTILILASWDLLATARYGLRRHKQLEQDRYAMLDMEAREIRRRRQELN